MGQCIGVVQQKGGCGKSSTAIALAYWLSFKHNLRTLLIDADAQRSSSKWASSLLQTIPCQIIGESDSLIEQVDKLAQSWDFVVIDGPGSLAEVTRAIVLLADLALMPCQPTGLDLSSASDTVRLIAQARAIRKGMPEGVAFLSRAVKGTRLKDEAREFLEDMPGITLMSSIVHQRQAIADSVGQQAVVWTMNDRAAADAAREYNNLFMEVMRCLSGNH
ncbi:MAG: AAA family ATPase [Chroococcidiopsis sp.]